MIVMSYRTRRRLVTVILAPAAALATWGVTRLIGVDLVVSIGNGEVGPGNVLFAALIGALAGWGAARLFERRSSNPRAWWSFTASTAIPVSLIGPSWLAEGSSLAALSAMHVVTALVVIVGFVPTIPVKAPRRADASRRPSRDLQERTTRSTAPRP
jgi:hypothetical protein